MTKLRGALKDAHTDVHVCIPEVPVRQKNIVLGGCSLHMRMHGLCIDFALIMIQRKDEMSRIGAEGKRGRKQARLKVHIGDSWIR